MLGSGVQMSRLLLSKHQSRDSFFYFCSPAPKQVKSDTKLWRGCRRWGWGGTSCVHPCAEMSWDNELPHVAEATLLRHESGLGARCDEWASSLYLFLSPRPSRGFKLFPYRSGMSCSGQPTFPVGTCMCLQHLPRGCCTTHSSLGRRIILCCVGELNSLRWCQVHCIYLVTPSAYPYSPFVNNFHASWSYWVVVYHAQN